MGEDARSAMARCMVGEGCFRAWGHVINCFNGAWRSYTRATVMSSRYRARIRDASCRHNTVHQGWSGAIALCAHLTTRTKHTHHVTLGTTLRVQRQEMCVLTLTSFYASLG
jgi:hypothetical protein